MTRVAAQHADQVVLNLVTPEHIGEVRAVVDREADRVGRTPPPLAVWVPVAVDPGERAQRQLASQLAIYLAPPGYGEMFSRLGFSKLVARARSGERRSELAAQVPDELMRQVCAVGSPGEIAARITDYHRAGAAIVGVVPSTAEDPGGRRALSAVTAARGVST
jgi:alkanesulfonate monooxygenase SsuD/methylene tetrahydromethanopterin reductase-like flavin-dependent oxidoreductase (luciferase family)